mmetsp:Transcript_53157/g.106621  ORF Transcript_53157/g.106621 Transcript_53157/m.106621 type:complete len:232 (-) Transcript_53157:194-889(-)
MVEHLLRARVARLVLVQRLQPLPRLLLPLPRVAQNHELPPPVLPQPPILVLLLPQSRRGLQQGRKPLRSGALGRVLLQPLDLHAELLPLVFQCRNLVFDLPGARRLRTKLVHLLVHLFETLLESFVVSVEVHQHFILHKFLRDGFGDEELGEVRPLGELGQALQSPVQNGVHHMLLALGQPANHLLAFVFVGGHRVLENVQESQELVHEDLALRFAHVATHCFVHHSEHIH